jgi:hypothetical protein
VRGEAWVRKVGAAGGIPRLNQSSASPGSFTWNKVLMVLRLGIKVCKAQVHICESEMRARDVA